MIPLLKPREAIQALKQFGWEVARQTGSHIILTKPGSIVSLSIPNHPEVARGTLRSLLEKAGITAGDFRRAAGK